MNFERSCSWSLLVCSVTASPVEILSARRVMSGFSNAMTAMMSTGQ